MCKRIPFVKKQASYLQFSESRLQLTIYWENDIPSISVQRCNYRPNKTSGIIYLCTTGSNIHLAHLCTSFTVEKKLNISGQWSCLSMPIGAPPAGHKSKQFCSKNWNKSRQIIGRIPLPVTIKQISCFCWVKLWVEIFARNNPATVVKFENGSFVI